VEEPGYPGYVAAARNSPFEKNKLELTLTSCVITTYVLSRLDRRFQDLEIRRAFTVFQLMTILEEATTP